jgi:hypothetical protein
MQPRRLRFLTGPIYDNVLRGCCSQGTLAEREGALMLDVVFGTIGSLGAAAAMISTYFDIRGHYTKVLWVYDILDEA